MYFILISEIELLCLPIGIKKESNPQTIINAYGVMQKKESEIFSRWNTE